MFEKLMTPFSRNLYGKCDDEIKFRVPGAHRQRIQQLAHAAGTTESDFMRDLVAERVEGMDHHLTVLETRALLVAGEGHIRTTNRTQQ